MYQTGPDVLGSKKLHILYVLKEDFVVPNFNNYDLLPDHQKASYRGPDEDGNFCDAVYAPDGTPIYNIGAGIVFSGREIQSFEQNPIEINIALQLMNPDSGSTDLEYTAAGGPGDLRVQPHQDHVNQIANGVEGDFTDECATCNQQFASSLWDDGFAEVAGTMNNPFTIMNNINSNSTTEQVNNINAWPCRSVRLSVPNGATVGNGGMPDKIRFKLITTAQAYGSGGWPLIGQTGFSAPPSFPQNETVEAEYDVNPYHISDMSLYNFLTFETASGAMVVDATNVEITQISVTEYEIAIPVDPNFTAPNGQGEITIMVPYTAYTTCFNSLGQPIDCSD